MGVALDRSLHIELSDPTFVHNFTPVLLMVFEIVGFKLKNENNNTFYHICRVCSAILTKA